MRVCEMRGGGLWWPLPWDFLRYWSVLVFRFGWGVRCVLLRFWQNHDEIWTLYACRLKRMWPRPRLAKSSSVNQLPRNDGVLGKRYPMWKEERSGEETKVGRVHAYETPATIPAGGGEPSIRALYETPEKAQSIYSQKNQKKTAAK